MYYYNNNYISETFVTVEYLDINKLFEKNILNLKTGKKYYIYQKKLVDILFQILSKSDKEKINKIKKIINKVRVAITDWEINPFNQT